MIRTPDKPKMEMIHSMTVQVLKVSRIVKPKYSLNIQNPVSLTCESIRLPAPTDSTINSGEVPEWIKGITRPAVVKAATVAEPNVIRSKAAITHPSSRGGIDQVAAMLLTISP